ncbi:hypothetical protein KUV65_12225 [Maritalea mobilis]|uniref:Uncharacterized protein n=1 Tax=[Roseibacterium] beibuensis TaxID=1193142 RepID=A0ABP9LBQ7_9RHOB|nr:MULTISPECIES: hypothetical protein [Alphaproteobacteria]MBY6202135.1 hypothetical protein [Maritalea mobilis]MCS6624257.1 hypothetical protein [Roseibacterium beibuensis]
MSVPRSEEILAVAKENVAAFIRDQASTRSLTPIIRTLNDDLLSGDETARDMAARALAHLGFLERA